MTVEELNIKITADAENFKKAIADANTAMDSFKARAAEAGGELTEAFSGLLELRISGENKAPSPDTVSPAQIAEGFGRTGITSDRSSAPETPSAAGFAAYFENTQSIRSGTAVLPELDGVSAAAVSSAGNVPEVQPVNITTTIELDGDKVGESVSRYFVRRNKITNGIED